MAEKSFPLENTDYAAEDAQLWFATRTSGVYAGEHLAVEAAEGLNVTINPGIAWLKYSTFGGIVYGNTDAITKAVGMSDANYTRIDRVCIRFDIIANTCGIVVKAGTPASQPEPPALTRDVTAYEISIAKITVNAGATAITSADITDERLDDTVCGLMSDGVTGVDTSVMQAQFDALLKNVQEALEGIYEAIDPPGVVTYTVTVPFAAGDAVQWTFQGSGAYQDVTVDGLLPSDMAFIDLDLSAYDVGADVVAVEDAFARIGRASIPTANTLRLISYNGIPSADIPLLVKVVR